MINLKTYFKELFEADNFKARSKESGKLVQFKSKDAYNAALKAGTHEDPKAPKSGKAGGKDSKKDAPKVNIFDKPAASDDDAKDRGGEAPKSDGMETVKSIAAKTGLRTQAIAGWADENGVNLSKVADDIKSKKLKPIDFMTAVSGNPGNKYAKDIIAKYSQTASPKVTPADLAVDKVVYNTRTKSVGIVRLPLERGEVKTDADGNVNADELEPYNPMKYPHQKDAKVAPSTQKEVDSRGLWNPFAQDEPKSEPKKKRPGNPQVNKEAKKKAEEFGITPQKLGNEGYKKVMYQAAVEALTDANFHDEARELIASIEGKPEWANRVDYPKTDDPKYKEKMADIRKNGVDSSEYWGSDDNAHEFGRKVAASSGWGGVEAADGIAFTLRMNGFHKEADKIQSIFDNKPYMRETSLKSVFKETKYYKSNPKVIKEAFNVNRDLPTWLFDDPVDFEGWYDDGMKLDKGKGKLAPFNSSDEKKLIQLVGIWQDAEGDYQLGRPGARSDSYSAQDAIKKLLFLKGKVVKNEVVNEATLEKGTKLRYDKNSNVVDYVVDKKYIGRDGYPRYTLKVVTSNTKNIKVGSTIEYDDARLTGLIRNRVMTFVKN